MDEILINSWFFYYLLFAIPLIYWYFTRNFNYWSKRGIKGPKPLICFGNVLSQFFTPKPYLLLEWERKYGRIYGTYIGNKPQLVLGEPELIKAVCVEDFHLFTERSRTRTFHPILGKHIGAQKDENWKRLRSITSPTFSSGKMKRMYPMVRQCLTDVLEQLEMYAKDRQEVNIEDVFGNYTMDTIATCAFATKINAHKDPNNPFVVNARKIFAPTVFKLIAVNIFPEFLLKFLNILHPVDENANQFFFNLTRSIIHDRKSCNNNDKYNDFIHLLLNAEKNDKNINRDENDINESHHVNEGEEERAAELKALNGISKYITEDEILAQSWAFFAAGYETTATTLTFCAYELALNQNIQQRLYEEVVTVVDSKGEIDYDLLSKLPYLDAVISETLRLYAPVLIVIRHASEDYKLADTGITVHKGQRIEIPIFAIHRSEEFYEKPLKFNPKRFLPENRQNIKPYTYLPFGVGPRSCVAMRFALMEAKLGLTQILQRYRFFRSPQTDVPLVLNKSPLIHKPKRVIVGIEKR